MLKASYPHPALSAYNKVRPSLNPPLRLGERPVIALTVNGKKVQVDAALDTPILWVLRDHLGLTGTKYSCGIAQCGACTVHLDGVPVRACVTPLSTVQGKKNQHHRRLEFQNRPRRAECLGKAGSGAMRLLPIGTNHVRRGPARQ